MLMSIRPMPEEKFKNRFQYEVKGRKDGGQHEKVLIGDIQIKSGHEVPGSEEADNVRDNSDKDFCGEFHVCYFTIQALKSQNPNF